MRGRKAKVRKVELDAKYGSALVARLINHIMVGGKKNVAAKCIYDLLESGAKQVNDDPLPFLEKAIANIKPYVELRSRRVGGANYSVPVPVTAKRQETLAMRWVIEDARSQKGGKLSKFLEKELVDAYRGVGEAIKKRENLEKMAEANRAFAHFKW